MQISEQELRTMIREAIARHTGGASAPPPVRVEAGRAAGHASHGLLIVPASIDEACVIEPAVRCDHCGYCKSLGH